MRSGILAAAVAVAAPMAARAAPRAEIGLRTGFALPLGDFSSGAPVSDAFNGFVPLGIELGVRYTPELSALVSFGYSLGLTTNCPAGDSCSGHQINLGLDLRYHLRPNQSIDPWIGLGTAFEWLGLSESGGINLDVTLNGFEYFHVQLGADMATRQSTSS
ncbi:MAG TPA: outer membrane beta-barrel protein [Myxococcales bacterium]|nr:outer membrane beta-barrel protein [Myxococcales bacterium]